MHHRIFSLLPFMYVKAWNNETAETTKGNLQLKDWTVNGNVIQIQGNR